MKKLFLSVALVLLLALFTACAPDGPIQSRKGLNFPRKKPKLPWIQTTLLTTAPKLKKALTLQRMMTMAQKPRMVSTSQMRTPKSRRTALNSAKTKWMTQQ